MSLKTYLKFRMDNRSFAIDPPQKMILGRTIVKITSIDPALVRSVKKWSQCGGILTLNFLNFLSGAKNEDISGKMA